MSFDNKTVLTLCGGGIRGIVHLGVINFLEQHNVLKNIKTFAGTSIGAIIAGLLVIGYNSSELLEFIKIIDSNKLFQIENFETIINTFGFDKGARFDFIIRNLLEKKNINPNITLHELFLQTNLELFVTSTNLQTGKGEYISHLTFPNLLFRTALRMSACVPLLISPVRVGEILYIDGGCTIPVPLDIFETKFSQVICVNLIFSENPITITNLESYILRVFKIMYDNSSLLIQKVPCDIINIPVDVFFSSFNLTATEKQGLFDVGYEYCEKYYKSKTD